MKKLTTAVLAALMITGVLAAASTPVKTSANSSIIKQNGPVPQCDPYSEPNCKIIN